MVTKLIQLSLVCHLGISVATSFAWATQSDEENDLKFARNLYRYAQDYATTADLFAEFIRNYPASEHLAEVRLDLARSYGRSQRCADAIPAYENFYRRHPDHLGTTAARRERAGCLEFVGRHAEAATAHKELQQLFPTSAFAAAALLHAGANYTQAQLHSQAKRTYAKTIRLYAIQPEAQTARYRLAQLHLAAGNARNALSLLDTIATIDPPAAESPAALLLAGRIHLLLGKPDAARYSFGDLFLRFAESAPADSAQLELATYLLEQGQYVQAVEAYGNALQHLENVHLKTRALLGLADAQRLSGQSQQALAHYTKLLARMDGEHSLYRRAKLGLAITRGQANQFTSAVSLFHDLLHSGLANAEAVASLRELGTLYRRRGDLQRSITWYESYLRSASSADDTDAVALALARVSADAGFTKRATDLYRNVINRESPLTALAHLGLAETFASHGQPRQALVEYTLFLERFPTHQRASTARQQIEYLRQFTVLDAAEFDRTLRNAWMAQLSGTPRRVVEFRVARTAYAHHDFAHSVSLFQHFAAAYPDQPESPEAQYFLAESLLMLGRQRHIEGRFSEADSLGALGLKEHRILATDSAGTWSQRSQLRLIEEEAKAGPDSLGWHTRAEGFARFLSQHKTSPHLEAALLSLADAQRGLGQMAPDSLIAAAQTYNTLLKRFPKFRQVDHALFGLAVVNSMLGAHSEATGLLQRILQDFPGSELAPDALFELGQIQLHQGYQRQALSHLHELRLAYPAFPELRTVQLQLADIYFNLGENTEAIDLYEPLVDDHQGTWDERRRLGLAYQQSGRHQDAYDMFEHILSEASETIGMDSIYFEQAISLVALNRPDEAVRRFLQVRNDFGASPLAENAARRAGELLFQQRNYDRAYAVYEPLLASTDDADMYGAAILALWRQNRPQDARKLGSSFVQEFPTASVWVQRFRLEEGQLLLAAGKFDQARDLFNDIEEDAGPLAYAGAFFAATALWQENQLSPSPELGAKALELQLQFLKAYGDSPRAPDVHYRLGEYHYATREFIRAAGRYRQVLESASEQEQRQRAAWMLQKSYFDAFEYDAAHQAAVNLLKAFPNHPQARQTELQIGIILKEKGRYRQSIDHLRAVLEWAAGNDASQARYYIGEAYQNLGEYRDAIKAYYQVRYHGEGFAAWVTSADYKRAQCHERLEEYNQAINVYHDIVLREGRASPQGQLGQNAIDRLLESPNTE